MEFVERARHAAAVAKWKPDVVHLQFPTRVIGPIGCMDPSLLLLLARIRVVQTWHEIMPMGKRSFPLCFSPAQ